MSPSARAGTLLVGDPAIRRSGDPAIRRSGRSGDPATLRGAAQTLGSDLDFVPWDMADARIDCVAVAVAGE